MPGKQEIHVIILQVVIKVQQHWGENLRESPRKQGSCEWHCPPAGCLHCLLPHISSHKEAGCRCSKHESVVILNSPACSSHCKISSLLAQGVHVGPPTGRSKPVTVTVPLWQNYKCLDLLKDEVTMPSQAPLPFSWMQRPMHLMILLHKTWIITAAAHQNLQNDS